LRNRDTEIPVAADERSEYERALRFLGELSRLAETGEHFARFGVAGLPELVASDMTTLSVCDLRHGTRSVISRSGETLSSADRECFNRHFSHHPLVRFHADHVGGPSHRISDSLTWPTFERSDLYQEYYRRIGIDHVVAVPLYVDRGLLVSFVLNRSRRDFNDREIDLLELLRPSLARLYRQFLLLDRFKAWADPITDGASGAAGDARLGGTPAGGSVHRAGLDTPPLTEREREVLGWVACGKSDGQIGAILGISARTVQKHLEHAYAKLGVESRTQVAALVLRNDPEHE
jgi:DNA-binding CsgD family transcriptional regulator